jgi:hypothetical protein
MLQAHSQCNLPVVARVETDAGGGAAQRAAAVSADDQRRAQHRAAFERDRNAVAVRVDRGHFVLDHA